MESVELLRAYEHLGLQVGVTMEDLFQPDNVRL